MHPLTPFPTSLQALKKPPKNLFFTGNQGLLERKKIAIVGTRKPNPYAKAFTQQIASMIAKYGGAVISGGALGVDIIPQADPSSGSMASAQITLSLNKPFYVLPHRIGESKGTNSLLAEGKAKAIYSVQQWIEEWFDSLIPAENQDEVLEFCKGIPSFEEAYQRFGERILEYELEGKVERKNGKIYVL